MRVLILGGDGMLGHQVLETLGGRHDVRVTLRQQLESYAPHGLFNRSNSYPGTDVRDRERLLRVFSDFSPEAVVNGVGIVKQRDEAHDSIASLEINALFPHVLAGICADSGARLVHMSTDCVFSGDRGAYTEADDSDARDLYGRTKFLGELHCSQCVTLRTSIIGLELTRKAGLIEWFLSQRGTIKGFTKAIYSGFTTMEMSRIIERLLTESPDLSGLWHVASQPIGKYDLLSSLCEKLGRDDIVIEPDDEFVCDRSLCGDRFEAESGYRAPDWDTMLDELAEMIKKRQGRE